MNYSNFEFLKSGDLVAAKNEFECRISSENKLLDNKIIEVKKRDFFIVVNHIRKRGVVRMLFYCHDMQSYSIVYFNYYWSGYFIKLSC